MMTGMEVGSITVIPVLDGVGRVTPSQLFAPALLSDEGRGREGSDWLAHAEFLDGNGNLEMPVGGLLVLTADRVMLVDVGYGPTYPASVEHGASLLVNLRALGFGAEDVTDVVFTHLHGDHIGWASVDGVATFPRATYRCDERDWAFFVDGPSAGPANRDQAQEKLRPVGEQLQTWSADGAICAGVETMHAPGHTPGNSIIVLSSGSQRALFLGDVVHCPVQLLEDDWARIADVDGALARRTQMRVAQELASSGVVAVGAHFPGLRFGRVLAGDVGRRWVVP